MGIITLTDRISVRVSAKNDTQSNDYKKATGGAIANKLGNGNVSDSLKSQLGNTKNPTITDENGDTWVSMEDMIDAGKAMNGDGAFATDEIHDGIDGINLGQVHSGPMTLINTVLSLTDHYCYEIPGNVYFYFFNSGNGVKLFSKNQFQVHEYKKKADTGDISGESYSNSTASTQTINGVSYSFFTMSSVKSYKLDDNVNASDYGIITGTSNEYTAMAAYLFGPVHTTGGSSYDWTKTDAELEEDIRDQEEVWDVIQNAVSSSSPTAKIPVGPYVNVGHIDDSWDSTSGGGHTGGDF